MFAKAQFLCIKYFWQQTIKKKRRNLFLGFIDVCANLFIFETDESNKIFECLKIENDSPAFC